jgi:hypothetical protein
MSLREFFPIQSGRLRVGEKGDLLYFRHVDLRVSAQIMMERSRSTLLRSDDYEIEWFSHSMEGSRLDGVHAPCIGRLQQSRRIALSNRTIGFSNAVADGAGRNIRRPGVYRSRSQQRSPLFRQPSVDICSGYVVLT